MLDRRMAFAWFGQLPHYQLQITVIGRSKYEQRKGVNGNCFCLPTGSIQILRLLDSERRQRDQHCACANFLCYFYHHDYDDHYNTE